MFCPPGYMPLSAVSVDFQEWLSALLKASIEFGDPLQLNGKDSSEFNKYCTAHSYHEFPIFLEECPSAAICGFDGTLLKPHMMYFLDRADFLWQYDWFPPELKSWDYQFVFVNPDTFTLSLNYWRNLLSEAVKNGGSEDWHDYQVRSEVISPFEGWALCINEEDDNRIPEYIVKRFELPNQVLIEARGTTENISGQRRGRPRLAKAREEFARMSYDKGVRSWEQTALHLERMTGEKPSYRTLRTWAQEGD